MQSLQLQLLVDAMKDDPAGNTILATLGVLIVSGLVLMMIHWVYEWR